MRVAKALVHLPCQMDKVFASSPGTPCFLLYAWRVLFQWDRPLPSEKPAKQTWRFLLDGCIACTRQWDRPTAPCSGRIRDTRPLYWAGAQVHCSQRNKPKRPSRSCCSRRAWHAGLHTCLRTDMGCGGCQGPALGNAAEQDGTVRPTPNQNPSASSGGRPAQPPRRHQVSILSSAELHHDAVALSHLS